MKKLGLAVVVCVIASATFARAQDKPRVFVQGKGSQDVTSTGSGVGGKHWGSWGSSSTIDSHDESMEITKDLQKNCGGAIVTLNQSNADYTIMLNRESKKNRGLLRNNSQVQVANRAGDVLGTNATHTVGNAAKDACQMILADWQTHGRVSAQEAQTPPLASATPTVVPAVATQAEPPGARLQNATATSGTGQPQAAADPVVTSVTIPSAAESVADAARKQKQHQACLELAKDNPSIVCK
jgi:hypothetical protein